MLISLQSTLNSIIMNNRTNNNLENYLYTNTLATIWLLVISYILVEFGVIQCAVILTDILFCNLLMYWLYNLQLFWLFHGRFEVTCRPVTWRHMEYLSMLAVVHEGKDPEKRLFNTWNGKRSHYDLISRQQTHNKNLLGLSIGFTV